jgi:hypothetical protein
MNLSIAVQHHPSRGHLLQLLDQLGGFELVTDPEPDSTVRSALRTYLEALRRTPAHATHRLVVQDDAIACPGFCDLAEKAITERPGDLIAFFVPGRTLLWKLMLESHERGDRWLQFPNYNWVPTVALCWPVDLIADFLEYAEAVVAQRAHRGLHTHGDDPYIGEWKKKRRLPVWATVPCLVQHPDREPSLIRPDLKPKAGANRARAAALFVGDL